MKLRRPSSAVAMLSVPLVWGALALPACGKSSQGVCTTDAATDTAIETDTTLADSEPQPDTTKLEDTVPATEIVDARPEADEASVLPQCPWEPWDEGLVGGRVDMVAFDPRIPGAVWASSGGALVRSLDSGVSWEPSSPDLAPTRLAFPPDDTKDLLAANAGGVWLSEDAGRSFDPKALTGLSVSALLIHPAVPQRVFAGTRGAGILRSDDGGTGFYPVNVGVPRLLVEALAAPADDADVVLATGVLQSDAYGIGASGVILRSSDGGKSWATVSTDVVWGYDLSICPSDPQRVLAAVRRGAAESHDGGLTWTRVPLLGNRDVLGVAWSAAHCDAYWVSVYREGIYRIDDDGATLTGPLNDGFDFELERYAGQIAAHPTDPDVVLAATHAGLYRSGDGGYHWRSVDAAKGLVVFDMDGSGDRVWMATWGNRLWTRTLTTSWEKVGSLPRDFIAIVAPDPTDAERAFVGSSTDAWLTDSGPGGFYVTPGVRNPIDALQLDDPHELLVATQVTGVVRSADTSTWEDSNTGLTPFETAAGTFIDARALASDPNIVGRIYLATFGRGVVVSDDRGHSWQSPDNALSDKQVVRLIAAKHAGGTRLYALVGSFGVWISDDGATTWTTKNEGFDSLGLGDLAIDEPTGRVFVSENGGPIHVSDDGLSWRPYDRWCLPDGGWGALAIVESGGVRWLVASSGGNRVIRRKL